MYQNRYPSPTSNNVHMDTYLKTIINYCDFITRWGNELGKVYNLNSGILKLGVHEFNKYPTNRIWPVYGWIVQDS